MDASTNRREVPVDRVLEIESAYGEELFRISIVHSEIGERRLKDLERVLERFLDDYEIIPTRAMLAKRLR